VQPIKIKITIVYTTHYIRYYVYDDLQDSKFMKNLGAVYNSLRTRWGLSRFLAIVIPALLILISVDQSPNFYTKLLNEDGAFLFALASAAFLLITVYSSYSKIYKFRVFFMGHLFVGTTMLYLFITRFAFANGESPLTLSHIPKNFQDIALRLLLILVSLNTIAASFAPSTLRQRNTKLFSLIVVIAEAALLFITLKNLNNFDLFSREGITNCIVVLNIAAIISSFLNMKEDNSFGGVIAAVALVNIGITVSAFSDVPAVGHALIITTPLLISIGIVLYWFSCLHHRVAYDPLMKIYNRDYAHHVISGYADVSLGSCYVVAMIDIDHFKSVNDTYGHQAGDAVLYTTAQRIRNIVMPRGIACRYGGEEIVIFFRNTKESDAYSICEAIRREVRRIKHRAADREFAITVSIGMTECDEPDIPIDRTLKAADEALYQAKETGRNKVLIGRIKKRVNLSMPQTGKERRQMVSQ
jgi:diguanylate cyclase (GGDEF)-like protein